MTNTVWTVAIIAASIFTLSACDTYHERADLPPGTYERTTNSTDAYGTETTREKTTDVSVDDDGTKKVVVKSRTTEDPRGLFNKRTTESEETYEEK